MTKSQVPPLTFAARGAGVVALALVASGPVLAGPCGTTSQTKAATLYPLPADGQWGFADTEGAWAVAPQWRQVRPFSEGRAAVATDAGWGIIDESGAYVIEPGARDADRVIIGGDDFHLSAYKPFSEGCSAVTPADGDAHFVTRDGTRWDPPGLASEDVADLGSFSEGLAWFTLAPGSGDSDRRTGWIDTDGEVVIAPEFASGGAFVNGTAPASLSPDNHGYINTEGDPVFPGKFTLAAAGPIRDGLARVQIGNELGFYDGAFEGSEMSIASVTETNGSSTPIERAGDFHDGLAAAQPKGGINRLVWINTQGDITVDPEADGQVSICDTQRLAHYTNDLLPLVAGTGSVGCGNEPEVVYHGDDPRMGPERFLWHLPSESARLVWVDTRGGVTIDSSACRAEPGAAGDSATTDDGSLATAAYEMTLNGAVTADVPPQRTDTACNRSEYTLYGGEGTNDEGPWQLDLAGEGTWQGHPIGITLTFRLPAGLSAGTHEFGDTDDMVSANVWMSRLDGGIDAENPPAYSSETGTLTLEQFNREEATGRFSFKAGTHEDESKSIKITGSFNAVPYTTGAELQVTEVTGALEALATMMETPTSELLDPPEARIEDGRLVLQLGRYGPQLVFRFPTDEPDGTFTAGPDRDVAVEFAGTPVTAKGRISAERDGLVSGNFEAKVSEHPQLEGVGTISGEFAHIPVETGAGE